MKRLIKSLFPVLLIIAGLAIAGTALQSCRKRKPSPPQEAALVVSLNPNLGATDRATALGSSYNFQVKIDSPLPPQGVTIEVAYKKDSDGSAVFAQSYTTTLASQDVTVTNLPYNEVGTVTVKVTSKTKGDNTVSKTFKLVKK